MPHSVLEPLPLLKPNAQYRFSWEADPSDTAYGFTTGAGPANTPPPLPELIETLELRNWNYLIERGLQLEFAHEGILVAAVEGDLVDAASVWDLLLDEAALGAAEPGEIPPIIDPPPMIRWWTTSEYLLVGTGPCGLWPVDPDEPLRVRFGVLDFAGNFSGWLPAMELRLPDLRELEAPLGAAEREASVGAPGGYELPATRRSDDWRETNHARCAMAPGLRAGGTSLAALLGLAFALAWRRQSAS
jgi:hypothetical protein